MIMSDRLHNMKPGNDCMYLGTLHDIRRLGGKGVLFFCWLALVWMVLAGVRWIWICLEDHIQRPRCVG